MHTLTPLHPQTHTYTLTHSVLEAALSVAVMNPTVITLAVVVITLRPRHTHTDACTYRIPLHTQKHTHTHSPADFLLIHHATPHGVACGRVGMQLRWR